jgi:urease accessory protein UreH
LWWSDAMTSGRVSRGERWEFRQVRHALAVRVGGSMRYVERYQLEPGTTMPQRRWVAGGANYFSTMVIHHDRVSPEHAADAHQLLQQIDGVHAAVDALDSRMIAVRLMASSGAPFAIARAACRSAALDRIFESPGLVGRKSV